MAAERARPLEHPLPQAASRPLGHWFREHPFVWVGAVLGLVLLAGLFFAFMQADAAEVARGKQLYTEKKCSVCHSIAGQGGRAGPALDGVGKKWTLDKMVAFLRSPSSVNPKSAMPPARGTPEEIRSIAAYVMSLR
ncbi:MAG: cytochrome c [Armatimonadetes bacterium]|nr:cytochrome c [Armatimonadota bacterium]